MKKILIIAQYEYWQTVRKFTFILLTLIFPIFCLFLAILGDLMGNYQINTLKRKMQEANKIGFLDETNRFKFPKFLISKKIEFEQEKTYIPAMKFKVMKYYEEETLQDDLIKGKISLYFIIPKNYLEKGKIYFYSTKKDSLIISERLAPIGEIKKVLKKNLLPKNLSPKLIKRILEPIKKEKFFWLDEKGKLQKSSFEKVFSHFLFSLIFTFFFIMAMFFSCSYLVQGLGEEKENKVLEIILSSVSYQELFLGKIIGLGFVGLTQVFFWSIPSFWIFPQILFNFQIPIFKILLCLVYFLIGYWLHSSLMLGLGSLGTTARESQQISSFLFLFSLFPLFLIFFIMETPNNLMAKIFSYFPLTSSSIMIYRIVITKISLTEIFLTTFVLLIFTYIIIKISLKIFNFSLLIYNLRPSLSETYKNLIR